MRVINGFIMLVLLAVAMDPAFGQDTLWTRNYGFTGTSDQGMCGCLTSDGGYAISGYSTNFPNGDMWVVRADQNGDTLWTRNFGVARWQQADYIIQTNDGGFVLAGHYDVAVGDDQFAILRLNPEGDSLWLRLFGTAGSDDQGRAVIELSDDNFMAVGYGRNAGTTDLYMIKVDGSGNMLWSRLYGGSGSDYGYGVVELADGGLAITGSTSSGSTGGSDLWLLRTNADGDTLWTRKYDFHGDLDRGDGIVLADDGDFVIGGRTWNGGYAQLLGLRVDSLGNQVWAGEFGVLGDGEFAESIDRTLDGGFVIGGGKGYITFDFYVVRLNANGDSIWAATYNGATGRSDDCYEIRVDSNGDVFAFGYTDIAPAAPSDLQYWAVKIDDGAYQGGGSPEIDIMPMAIIDTLDVDSSASHNLYIANIGEDWLNYGLHDNQAWVIVIPDTGRIAVSGVDTISVILSAAGLTPGDYDGQIMVNSDDTNEAVTMIPVTMTVIGGSVNCPYIPGDVNNVPPANGIDVTYGVAYFKGGNPPPVTCPMCPRPHPFYAALDVNGSCTTNGIDITYFVAFLKGGPALIHCPDCPPARR